MTQKRSGSRSRNKGKRGELELAHVLRRYGFDARRGQQYAGVNGDADVVGVPGLHIECKRVETLNVEKALVQSEQDARTGEIPVVMHRKNGEEWKITMRLDDFFAGNWKGRSGEEILRIAQSLMQYGPQDYRKEIYNSALRDLIRALELEEERSNEDGRR